MQTEEDDWIGGLTWGEEGAGESRFLEESLRAQTELN